MATTLQDIARRVNLSESLVRGVLKDRPNVWASPENRRRIVEAARELNYRPNAAARALATGSTRTVGFTYLRPANDNLREVTGRLIEGCAERLSSIDFTLGVHVYERESTLMENLRSLALSRACDAFVLWGTESEMEEPGRLLESLRVPFVAKGYFDEAHPDWFQIDFGHVQMMHDAVDLLISLGHRRIACMGSAYPGRWQENYLRGYREAIRRASGSEADDDLVCRPEDSLAEYDAAMSRWLALPARRRPTAVIVTTTVRAWRGIEIALARVGRRAGTGTGEVLIAGRLGEGSDVPPLIHGRGYAFEETTMFTLGEMITERLLKPLLRRETPSQAVVRLVPALALTDDEYTSSYHAAAGQWANALRRGEQQPL